MSVTATRLDMKVLGELREIMNKGRLDVVSEISSAVQRRHKCSGIERLSRL